jgi:D-alanyl-D-alanine carboxypeptidase (penicillin-binding protein 5/6)
MKQVVRFVCALLILGTTAAQGAPDFVPEAPDIAAEGYLLQDHHSGRILAEKNADERLEPASLTKLMTAYTVFHELRSGNITENEQVHVSKKAWKTGGSRMFIRVNTEVPVEALLKGMIIQSGNDASVALAEHVAGSEEAFAALMNAHADSLGMTGTHFVNSTGLPHPEHYSTPRDMAILARALIREFPSYYSLYSERKYTYNDITQYNRNKLLWRDDSVDGLKTGHTDAAGYCLVASAKREDMRLISVVMGTKSENARAQESQALLNYGFRFFRTHKLYAAGDTVKAIRVWKGETESLPLGLAEDLYVTVPRGRYDQLDASVTVGRNVTAPVKNGEMLGNVTLQLGGETLMERPLVALQNVSEGGIWQYVVDSVLLLFE